MGGRWGEGVTGGAVAPPVKDEGGRMKDENIVIVGEASDPEADPEADPRLGCPT
jgi:hypothetical protein